MTSHPRRSPAVRCLGTIPTGVAGVAIAIVLAATACSGPRSGVSAISDISGCAAVLPLAHHTVHAQGTLTVVQRINKAGVDTLTREVGATPHPARHHRASKPHPIRAAAQAKPPKACLVVYHGDYPPGTITGASPPAVAGHYALMVLRIRHPAVDRIFVTETLPPSVHR
ncbi:MAG: hypothetical protein ACRDSP_04510 [Pseudonocardiaceae bacterium]